MSSICDYMTEETHEQFLDEIYNDNVNYVKLVAHNIPNEMLQDYINFAVYTRSIDVLKYFLGRGLSPHIDNDPIIPLIHSLAGQHHHAVIRLLVEHGVDINSQNKWNQTALHWVVLNLINYTEQSLSDYWGRQNDCKETIKLLLALGTNPLLQDHKGATVKNMVDKHCKQDIKDMFCNVGQYTKAAMK